MENTFYPLAKSNRTNKVGRKPFFPKAGPVVESSVDAGGKKLDGATRSFMEGQFGYDFSNVNVHDNTVAAKSAQSINAHAYTSGNNIVFNTGQYNPSTNHGRKLLAHELTHVVQQTGGIQRKGSNLISPVVQSGQGKISSVNRRTIQREEGTSQMEDTVRNQTQDPDTGIWSGTVDRREFVPASDGNAERTLGTLTGVRISFNPNTCTVTLPTKLKFEHPNATNWPSCGADHGNPVPNPQLDSDAFDALKARYIRLTNQWLNGWYTVRLTNCEGDCTNRDININVAVEEDASNADTTVVLANTTGRSCASPSQVTLHAQGLRGGGIMDDRLIHESGHMALGYLDEYPVSEGNADEESVRRGDFSAAGSSSSFRDWMQLHERHFSFVTEFLQTIYPGCRAELVEVSRPEVNFEFTGVFGGTSYQGGGYYFDLGFNFQLPLTRSRDWQLFLGAHSQVLLPLLQADRTAFMLGARLGFQHTFGMSSGGFQWGGFGEFGYGTFGRETPGTSESERFGAPYYSVGGNLGYSFSPTAGTIPFFGLEGGYGSTILSDEDRAIYGNNEWFFMGLNAGVQWR